jgi:hypothetical protein
MAKIENISVEEYKNQATEQNKLILFFFSNEIIKEAVTELNKFIKNPNYFVIKAEPEKPISVNEIKNKAKENYFDLLRLLKIKFNAKSKE